VCQPSPVCTTVASVFALLMRLWSGLQNHRLVAGRLLCVVRMVRIDLAV
jgi:hypothetical protein